MEPSELRKLIANKSNKDWYNNVEFDLTFPSVDLELNFKGIVALYSFAKQQYNDWRKIELPRFNHLISSRTQFEIIIDNII